MTYSLNEVNALAEFGKACKILRSKVNKSNIEEKYEFFYYSKSSWKLLLEQSAKRIS